MERSISASEANQRFSAMLRDVAEGESFTVTSRGKAVARLLPVDRGTDQQAVARLLDQVRALPIRHAGSWTRAELYE